jgi:bacteriochlorophyll c synthase
MNIANMASSMALTRLDKFKAHLELLDPITWVGVLQGIVCGAIASGGVTFTAEHIGQFALLALLFGPLGTGFSQSLNDYYDRDLDRVNEPTRPIPSGRITEKEALWNWIVVGCLTVIASGTLAFILGGHRGNLLILLTLLGLIVGYIYSAPPLKLKKNVLTSGPAVGLTYSFITWLAGNLVFSELREEVIWMALINAMIAVGLIFLNDFKSIEGDRAQGMKSLPVMIGVRGTYLVSFLIIDIAFAMFVYWMRMWDFTWLFYVSLFSLILIMVMQVILYLDPEDGAAALDGAVQKTGLRNVVGKSDAKTHKSFLRYLVVNNGLYVINVICAAVMIAQR